MTIAVGDKLPEATLVRMGDDGPEQFSVTALTQGRKVVIFAVPGAFTAGCHKLHVPGFINNADAIRARGVDEIICVAVNDPFVMKAWSDATGADKAGITMLSDPQGAFAKALDLTLDVPAIGLIGRSQRYAMLAEDGVVTVFNLETERGVDVSSGETMLASLEGKSSAA